MALQWEFHEDTCRWAAESKHAGEDGKPLLWKIFVFEDGVFSVEESEEPLYDLFDRTGEFFTLQAATKWCQLAEDSESTPWRVQRCCRA